MEKKVLFILFLLFFSLLAPAIFQTTEIVKAYKADEPDKFYIWVTTDPQTQSKNMAEAINDSIDFFDHWDIALVLGDLINDDDFDWPIFLDHVVNLSRLSGSNHSREDFYMLAGNHDTHLTEGWNLFDEYIDPLGNNPTTSYVNNSNRPFNLTNSTENEETQLYYQVELKNDTCVTNLEIMMLSNKMNVSCCACNQYPVAWYDWWVKRVENNTDNIKITCTHHGLDDAGTGYSGGPTGGQMLSTDAARFVDYLNNTHNESVDLWMFGHIHWRLDYYTNGHDGLYPKLLNASQANNNSKDMNVTFLNAGSLITNDRLAMHSYMLEFTNNSRYVELSEFGHYNDTWSVFETSSDQIYIGNVTLTMHKPFTIWRAGADNAPTVNKKSISMPDYNGAIWDVYLNQYDSHVKLECNETNDFGVPRYTFWDNESSDGGEHGYRYHFQEADLSNGFTANCTVYYRFICYNGSTPVLSTNNTGHISLWSPYVTAISPTDAAEIGNVSTYINATINITNGGNFTYVIYNESYFAVGEALAAGSGTNQSVSYHWQNLEYSTKYTWCIQIETNNTEDNGNISVRTNAWGTANEITFWTMNNTAPVTSTPIPANESTGISVNLANLTFNLTDADGDAMNVTFALYCIALLPGEYVGGDGGNGLTNGTNNISLGGEIPFLPLEYSSEYTWWINVTDIRGRTDSDMFTFTTGVAPNQSGEVPTNGSTGISLTPDLYVLCTDDDNDNLNATWWSNSSGTWIQFASNWTSFANNTNITQSFTNASVYSTTYWWSVNLTDGDSWTNETYGFTTESAPSDPSPPGGGGGSVSPPADDERKTPGFEMITLIGAVALCFVLLKKKERKNL